MLDPYREFRSAAGQAEEKIDLGRAALGLALFDYPQLDIAAYLHRIDALAVEAAKLCSNTASTQQSLDVLNAVLFQQHGFRGNRTDYYDPKNSFLHEVLDRKIGIPITLSVLYMEVGQRVGIPLEGVGFPGHFLVKLVHGGVEVLVDPFHGGEMRSREDLSSMLVNAYGSAVSLEDRFFRATTKKEILKRMLGNLRGIYAKANDLTRLLAVLDLGLILDPGEAEQVRERARVYLRLECYTQARQDFESYLRLAPDAEDADSIRSQLVGLSRRVTLIH